MKSMWGFFCHNVGSRSDNLFDHDEIYLIYYHASNAKAPCNQESEYPIIGKTVQKEESGELHRKR